jgi:CDP-diacylglycerol--glycerol-3-phosphate 3-phosphatidyltransferase
MKTTALNIPNQITIARLMMAIVFFILLSQYSQRAPHSGMLLVATVLFVVAAVSDFFDGYLARRWGQITTLGRVLDPLVDKVLVCGAFILLAGPGFVDEHGHTVTEVSAWMVVLIVGREMLVTGLRGFNESIGMAFGASIYGKLKMWMQSIAVPVILFLVAREQELGWGEATRTIKLVLVWMTVAVTALSMVSYLTKSRHLLEEGAPS